MSREVECQESGMGVKESRRAVLSRSIIRGISYAPSQNSGDRLLARARRDGQAGSESVRYVYSRLPRRSRSG